MNVDEDTLKDVTEVVTADLEGFWLLIGDIGGPEEPRRREALMGLMTRAFGKGYERGLRRAADLVAAR